MFLRVVATIAIFVTSRCFFFFVEGNLLRSRSGFVTRGYSTCFYNILKKLRSPSDHGCDRFFFEAISPSELRSATNQEDDFVTLEETLPGQIDRRKDGSLPSHTGYCWAMESDVGKRGVGPLSMSVDELGKAVCGSGRARLIWDLYLQGVEPEAFFSEMGDGKWRHDVRKRIPTCRKSQTLGASALRTLSHLWRSAYGPTVSSIEDGLAALSHKSVSRDGTVKLLLRLSDHMEVETVIIPWHNKGYSTLCVSSQVGCRQGCTFCATGRMGKVRSLTSDEILAQVYFSRKICREDNILPATRIVFMGMGEPADNAEEVKSSLRILTDVQLFQIGQAHITVSTIAPTPDAFRFFASSPCLLAWSVHAVNDHVRRTLVPTTAYTMVELREGLIDAILLRPDGRLRAVMLEYVLLDGINDSPAFAAELASFARVIVDRVPTVKLVVNLIPFNDIGRIAYCRPADENVRSFQKQLWEGGIFSHVRVTRGDSCDAACGQLATVTKFRSRVSV